MGLLRGFNIFSRKWSPNEPFHLIDPFDEGKFIFKYPARYTGEESMPHCGIQALSKLTGTTQQMQNYCIDCFNVNMIDINVILRKLTIQGTRK